MTPSSIRAFKNQHCAYSPSRVTTKSWLASSHSCYPRKALVGKEVISKNPEPRVTVCLFLTQLRKETGGRACEKVLQAVRQELLPSHAFSSLCHSARSEQGNCPRARPEHRKTHSNPTSRCPSTTWGTVLQCCVMSWVSIT